MTRRAIGWSLVLLLLVLSCCAFSPTGRSTIFLKFEYQPKSVFGEEGNSPECPANSSTSPTNQTAATHFNMLTMCPIVRFHHYFMLLASFPMRTIFIP
jgi:hypothetical protein